MSSKEKLLNQLSKQVQAQEVLLKDLQQQMGQQQSTLNEVFEKVKEQENMLMKTQQVEGTLNQILNHLQQNPTLPTSFSPPPVHPYPLSDLIKKIDVEKLTKLAMYVAELYMVDEE